MKQLAACIHSTKVMRLSGGWVMVVTFVSLHVRSQGLMNSGVVCPITWN